jgi:tubulin polyglutamylase TTLL6
MPSLKKYFVDLNYNMKQTLNLYLASIGKKPEEMWEKIENAISNVYIEKEEMMTKLTKERFSSAR